MKYTTVDENEMTRGVLIDNIFKKDKTDDFYNKKPFVIKTSYPLEISRCREIPRLPCYLGTSLVEALEIVREHYLLNPECKIFGDFMDFLKYHKSEKIFEKLIELEKNKIGE